MEDLKVHGWLSAALARLDELATLKANWDSYQAEPMTPAALIAARGYVSVMALISPVSAMPEPAIVPTNDGGIQLEWHQSGVDVEVYISPTGGVSGWTRDGTTEAEFS